MTSSYKTGDVPFQKLATLQLFILHNMDAHVPRSLSGISSDSMYNYDPPKPSEELREEEQNGEVEKRVLLGSSARHLFEPREVATGTFVVDTVDVVVQPLHRGHTQTRR